MNIDTFFAKPHITIKEHRDMLISELNRMKDYRYITDEKLYRLTYIACMHHDDGKVNEEFQKRVTGRQKRFNKEKEIPHNVLSAYFLNQDDFDTEEDYYKVLFAIIYHHNYGEPLTYLQEKQDLIQELLKDFSVKKFRRSQINRIKNMILDSEVIKIKGFLHKCDYSASGGYVSEYPNDFLEDAMDNVRKKWKEINPESNWNDLQKFCMNRRNENIIAIAQTGMGKTEAGLQWIGNSKGYFVLPIRTAINAIYDRVKNDILCAEDMHSVDTRLSILHSESLEYYLKQFDEGSVEEYEQRGKRLAIPLNISTLDQLFDFILKYPGYELKLTTFSYSKIVIDEIQMYDPELLRYLIYGLKMITQMGGKVAILTATLSPFIKTLLCRQIPFKEENTRIFVDDTIRHNIEIREEKINGSDIVEFYEKNKQSDIGNKILVVCNTIRKAQQLYRQLTDLLDCGEIHILHSRFTREDRARKEREIIEFGRTYDEYNRLDKKSGIWISTSLVEASLDIDFDYLFTELQDLNSLFQRLGRCNRKGKKDCSKPNCFIYTVIDASLLTTSDHGFIDRVIFDLSKEAINEGQGLLSEQRKIELLNKYMTFENLRDSDYYIRYNEAGWIERIDPYQFEKEETRLRNIRSQVIIPSPVYEQNKEKISVIITRLSEHDVSSLERMKLKEELLKYSVDIPYWQWSRYQKEQRKGRTENYPILQYGKNLVVSVMECHYDEAGFQVLDYENEIRCTNFI